MLLAAIIGSALESLLTVIARTAGDFKLALQDHQNVFEAIQSGNASNAAHRMAAMFSDTRALINRSDLQPSQTPKGKSQGFYLRHICMMNAVCHFGRLSTSP
jgi:DNA-binding FadR family transcriptional regulator